jgi:hypothetical protein
MATRGATDVEQGRGSTIGIQIWDPALDKFVDHSRCTPDEAKDLSTVRDSAGISRQWRAREMYGRGKIIRAGDSISMLLTQLGE